MGVVHVDTGILIGLLDRTDAHHVAALGVLRRVRGANHRLVMSAVAYAECMVAPSRAGERACRVVSEMFERLPIAVQPIDDAAALLAARLRAEHRTLRLPDALVIAAAVVGRATELVTTDQRWPAAQALGIGLDFTVVRPAGG